MRARLTEALGPLDAPPVDDCRLLCTRPVYDAAPRDWAAAVEEALAVPVLVTSHGPTAADKRPRR
ncbi:MAG TPA: hypothetical protein VHN18_10175 [Micromonosporaceae bacterium]|nr:hypothetical protein [Micromonosporaceae bacterium]